MFRRRLARGGRESGLAMLTVMSVGLVMTLFATTIAVSTLNTLGSARGDRDAQQAIQIAEGGVDTTAQQVSDGTAATDVVYPTDYATEFSYTGCERAWVLWVVSATVGGSSSAAPGSCHATANWTAPSVALPTGSTGDGRWVTIYPALPGGTAAGVVYGVGYSPTSGTGAMRIVRLAINVNSMTPYPVTDAVLTNTDFSTTAGGNITGAAGGVHSNEQVSWGGKGTASSNITAASCADSGCTAEKSHSCLGTGVPSGCLQANSGLSGPVSIPDLAPRSYWPYADFALCPDGHVHLGPAYSGGLGTAPPSTDVPCGSQDPSISTTLNWSACTGAGCTWTYSVRTAPTNAVYYAYDTSVQINTGSPATMTIIAEGGNDTTSCSPIGGAVTLSGGNAFGPATGTSINPLAVLADGPMSITAGGGLNGVFYTNNVFTETGGASNTDFAIISNDTHSPSCGTNTSTAGGTWNYNGDKTIPVPTAGSPLQYSSWLQL
jgi:Tfp pilus assembly protein PilX